MKTAHVSRTGLAVLALLLVLSACGTGGKVPAQPAPPTPTPEVGSRPAAEALDDVELPEIEWFQPMEGIVAGWTVRYDPQANPLLVLLEPRDTAEAAEPSKVLFLYTRTHIDFDKSVSTVLSTLSGQGSVVDAAVYLAEDELAGFEALAYAESNDYDLIFSVGSSTTAFLHENYKGRPIAVVSVLSKDPVLLGQMPNYTDGSGTNIAYTSVGIPVGLQMSYFRELVPGLKNIAIIYAQENSSVVVTQVEPLDEYAKTAGINLIHVPILYQDDPEQTRRDIEGRLPEAIGMLWEIDPQMTGSVLLVTSSGSITQQFETVNALSGTVPVVSLFPELVREGPISAVLSVGVSFESNSILAGVYGAQILRGEADPGELPVGVITPPDIAISFAKAREIGLKVPFHFFESATFVYDPDGELVRDKGQVVN
jgi:putative ABC transport system substrate-binding protein